MPTRHLENTATFLTIFTFVSYAVKTHGLDEIEKSCSLAGVR